MVQYLSLTSPLASLPDQNVAFPEYSSENDFRGKGYQLEEATGRPVFKYLYKGMEIEDKLYPDETNKMIIREILVKNSTENKGLYFKLAEGNDLKQLPDGTYIMGDKEFYVKVLSASKPIIREVNGKKELVVMANGQPIKYSIIW